MTMRQTPEPRRRQPNRALGVLLAVAAIVLVGCGIAACVGLFNGADDRTAGLGEQLSVVNPSVTPTPASTGGAKPAKRALEAADVKLGVKITDKQCFGSAGCVLEYKVEVDVPVDLLSASDRDWTVTYEVAGVTDGPQVATLTLHPDGTFEQDAYQSGQTPSRSTKLKAKATDVEPVL